ncbi:DMT family transporter [Brevibacillus choshinensis]|uniref:DMT family transporter n=1 Tax=Brevibacillus choshinensis TaxID=54911 RepID=A0ABX7FQB3_BRECH|nr:DMT family transporter [Brevibacillus choshinensis]QRG68291.1 DMT family transporter [Brevibacillus choshinensis]
MFGTRLRNNQLFYYGLLVITMLFWGSAFVGSKISVGMVPPTVAALLRFGFATLFMFTLILFITKGKKEKTIPKTHLPRIALLGLIGVALYNLLFFWGLSFSYSSDGSVMIPTSSPIVTALLAVFFLKDKMSRKQYLGLGICLAGGILFFAGVHNDGKLVTQRFLGDLLFLLSACCWGLYTMLGNKVLKQFSPLLVTAYAMLTGTVILFLFALKDLSSIDWGSFDYRFWMIQLYLGIFSTALANWFYYMGVKMIGAARASAFMYCVPVIGLFLSTTLLHETLTIAQLAGSVIMIVGVWFVNRRAKDATLKLHDKGKAIDT